MRVFLGSSKESVRLVRWASKFLKEDLALDPVPWESRLAFPPGVGTLEALKDLVEEVDAAIIFVTADDLTKHRGATKFTPRDNIIFESGLFLGALGVRRTHLVVQRGVDLRLPSDWAGITHEFFEETKKDPGITLRHTLGTIADDLKDLGPRGTPPIIREIQQGNEICGINAAVGPFRRVLEETVYPRVGKPDVAEVDVIVAYRFNEVATVMAPNLQRKEFRLRLCLANMWDEELAQIYLRKYYNRDLEHLRDGVKTSITVTLGRLKDWSKPARRDQAPRFVPESPPPARVEIYLTPQRVTHAYYRIDDLMCVVPLDMQKSATPPPRAWVFTKDQSAATYSYYKNHFDSVIKDKESISAYPIKRTKPKKVKGA